MNYLHMKRHLAWWTILILLLIAWAPFGVDALIYKIRGPNCCSDEWVALMFGFWLFVWWPSHIVISLLLLYKGIRWLVSHLRTSHSN